MHEPEEAHLLHLLDIIRINTRLIYHRVSHFAGQDCLQEYLVQSQCEDFFISKRRSSPQAAFRSGTDTSGIGLDHALDAGDRSDHQDCRRRSGDLLAGTTRLPWADLQGGQIPHDEGTAG